MALKALAKFVGAIKSDTKASRSFSNTLLQIVDDYTCTSAFERYIVTHAADAAAYIAPKHDKKRHGLFRASSAGKCRQQECFKVLNEPHTDAPQRKPGQLRALDNGTFVHARLHMLFDALHEQGSVTTVAAEELAYNDEYKLSGTIDRVIALPFDGQQVVSVVDFKSIKEQYYKQLVAPQEDHRAQQHAYGMLGWSDKAASWTMFYENKNTHELKIYDRPYDASVSARLVASWLSAIEWMDSYKKHGTAPFELELERSWCQFCPWRKRCKHLNPEQWSLK